MSDNDLWGFFNGANPHHEDVAAYFTPENHLEMFGVPFEGTDADLRAMAHKAHDLIAAYQDVCQERI